MEAILKFNLPEENDEFNSAINGSAYSSIVWELKQYLRSQLKYENLSSDADEALEKVKEKIFELENNFLNKEI